MPNCGELWRHYATALLRFGVGSAGGITVDLAAPITPRERQNLESIGWQGCFGVVTPCNPGARVLPEPRNEELLVDFEAYLRLMNIDHQLVIGMSRDYAYQEPGFAIRVELSRASIIAEEWGQLAFYWWDGGAFYLVPTRDCEITMERLPITLCDSPNSS